MVNLSEIHTVAIPKASINCIPKRTHADYVAKWDKLPPFAELARAESGKGKTSGQANFGIQGNAARMQAARERDDRMIVVILALLQDRPMSRSQIATALRASDDITKRVLHRMRDEGLIKAEGQFRYMWSAA